jgi:hypothetical protein
VFESQKNQRLPVIMPVDGFGYSKDSFPHDAGFDSYMTAVVFLKSAWKRAGDEGSREQTQTPRPSTINNRSTIGVAPASKSTPIKEAQIYDSPFAHLDPFSPEFRDKLASSSYLSTKFATPTRTNFVGHSDDASATSLSFDSPAETGSTMRDGKARDSLSALNQFHLAIAKASVSPSPAQRSCGTKFPKIIAGGLEVGVKVAGLSPLAATFVPPMRTTSSEAVNSSLSPKAAEYVPRRVPERFQERSYLDSSLGSQHNLQTALWPLAPNFSSAIGTTATDVSQSPGVMGHVAHEGYYIPAGTAMPQLVSDPLTHHIERSSCASNAEYLSQVTLNSPGRKGHSSKLSGTAKPFVPRLTSRGEDWSLVAHAAAQAKVKHETENGLFGFHGVREKTQEIAMNGTTSEMGSRITVVRQPFVRCRASSSSPQKGHSVGQNTPKKPAEDDYDKTLTSNGENGEENTDRVPNWESPFWKLYGNKLRVVNAGVLDLNG